MVFKEFIRTHVAARADTLDYFLVFNYAKACKDVTLVLFEVFTQSQHRSLLHGEIRRAYKYIDESKNNLEYFILYLIDGQEIAVIPNYDNLDVHWAVSVPEDFIRDLAILGWFDLEGSYINEAFYKGFDLTSREML